MRWMFASVCLVLAWAGSGGTVRATPANTLSSRTRPSACTVPHDPSFQYLARIARTELRLGVRPDYAGRHHLVIVPQARRLVVAENDIYGYPLRLAPGAAVALRAMQAAAARDHVVLHAVSGYRSFADQLALVRRRLRHGQSTRQALRVNDLPGFSQHQSGCAVDLATPGSPPVTVAFARTSAYRWLTQHAARFGFHLTYGQHNDHAVEFEPWHWVYRPRAVAPTSVAGRARPPRTVRQSRRTELAWLRELDRMHLTGANRVARGTVTPQARQAQARASGAGP